MNKNQLSKELIEIMNKERESLDNLLKILEEQYSYIIKDDVFKMDSIVEKIQNINGEVAEIELKRRNLVKDYIKSKTFSNFIFEFNDDNLEEAYRKVKMKLEEVRLQKDTNDLLLKQSISYTNRILAFLNPDREAKTYNGYGKMKRWG